MELFCVLYLDISGEEGKNISCHPPIPLPRPRPLLPFPAAPSPAVRVV